jgi:hypothetical protein
MKTQSLKCISLLLVMSVATPACSGGGEQSTPPETANLATPAAAEKKAALTPEEIGQKAGDLYIQAMSDLAAALKAKPAASEVKGKIESMREEYIQKLVGLGKLREKLDTSDRSKVDSQMRMKVRSVYNSPDYSTFNEVQKHYFSDQDFHKIVLSFNIITQYASFDLLRKQAPEEAARLGIQ